jgi:hypothetical protein
MLFCDQFGAAEKSQGSMGSFHISLGSMFEQGARGLFIAADSLAAPEEFAPPVKSEVIAGFGGAFEPGMGLLEILLFAGDLAEGELGPGLAAPGRFSVPIAGFLDILKDADAIKVEPAHGERSFGMARPGSRGIKGEGARQVLRPGSAFQAIE